VLDAGANRGRMIDEAHAMTVARRRDLIAMPRTPGGRWCRSRRAGKDLVSARSALFVARIKA
jgi:hypothetical protein